MKTKQYELVQNEEIDGRTPLRTENFNHSFVFHARLIGSMEIVKPTTRIEIVSAMRRIRFENKAKGVDKRRVTISVSKNGVRAHLRLNRFGKPKVQKSDESLLHSYPIYRIFFVSHDSQDCKIFSYIARESHGDIFTCSVFKAGRKALALRIVRTIGQAFEVGHASEQEEEEETFTVEPNSGAESDVDLSTTTTANNNNNNNKNNSRVVESSSDPLSLDLTNSESCDRFTDVSIGRLRMLCAPDDENDIGRCPFPSSTRLFSGSDSVADHRLCGDSAVTATLAVTMGAAAAAAVGNHELLLLREQLQQQLYQKQEALAQVKFMRDQLQVETAARVDAQTRASQLLAHNSQLLRYLRQLLQLLHHHQQQQQQQDNPVAVPAVTADLFSVSGLR